MNFIKDLLYGGDYPTYDIQPIYETMEGEHYPEDINPTSENIFVVDFEQDSTPFYVNPPFANISVGLFSSKGIWVMTGEGIICMIPSGKITDSLMKKSCNEYYHHSHIPQGGPVACGGEYRLKKNMKLGQLTNKSGHYMPPFRCITKSLNAELDRRDVDTSGIIYKEFIDKPLVGKYSF